MPKSSQFWVCSVVIGAFLALSACGGGSGSTPPPPAVTAPSGLSYPAPASYQIGRAITPLTPSVSGTVSSYAVSPALPAGLSLNTTSGGISGTPTAVTASASYTVTASNSGGSTNTTVVIVVTDVPATVVYDGGGNYTYTVGDPIDALIPTVSNDTVATWTISPSLPAGLTFNTANGTITGTPTATASAASYTVTAQTPGGAITDSNFVIQVQSGLLLELGNTASVEQLQFNGTRLLSGDNKGHWVLWDYAAAKILAHGTSACAPNACAAASYLPLYLHGSTLVISTLTGFDVYNATDGTVLSRITPSLSLDWWKLAADGSYIVGGNRSGLYIWSPDGKQITVKPGDYHVAEVAALPGEVRVALGIAQTAIETVSLPSGASTVSPAFQGAFLHWFADGARFYTQFNGIYWIYSNTAVQLDTLSGPPYIDGGQGNYFWSLDILSSPYVLNIYTVGASSSPVYSTSSFEIIKVEGNQMFVQKDPPAGPGTRAILVIDLSGNAPVATNYNLPANVFPQTVAATSGGQWAIGASHGVILDGSTLTTTPRYLGPGEVFSIAGSANRFAIATGTGRIMLFNNADHSPAGTIPLLSSKLKLSADGNVLVASGFGNDGQFVDDRSLYVYSLPGGTLTHTYPSAFSSPPYISDFTLSASGTVLGQISSNHQGLVLPTNGGATIWSGNTSSTGPTFRSDLSLSPDGTLLAVPTDLFSNPITSIYTNGVLTYAVNGYSPGWLDNGRLLVNNYTGNNSSYRSATIYSSTGAPLGTSLIPELRNITPVTADTIYVPALNRIYSLTTGNSVWSSPNPAVNIDYDGPDAIAGNEVVFVSGTTVRAETH